MVREIEMDEELVQELEQEESQEMQPYEVMVSKINETGFCERSVEELEEAQVAQDLLQELSWQEREPMKRRLGNVRGMARYLRGRPGRLHRSEIELLKTLRQIEEWGEALECFDPERASMAEELHQAAERCHFEDALFAATEDFFDLIKRLDEPWCV
jgi:hypothetical protein